MAKSITLAIVRNKNSTLVNSQLIKNTITQPFIANLNQTLTIDLREIDLKSYHSLDKISRRVRRI